MSVEARIRGSFFGGAVGDAIGAPVEFDTISRIRERFGTRGAMGYQAAFGRTGAITDDTQMTLFTAEGLIRGIVRASMRGIAYSVDIIDHAYARWLATQGVKSQRWDSDQFDGWLINVAALQHQRAPGMTCLSALRHQRAGSIENPVNDSKGCGGVMRVAPVGLLERALLPDPHFEFGCKTAALTHGHPSGYLAAGALAGIMASLVFGASSLAEAVDRVSQRLEGVRGHGEVLASLDAAVRLFASPQQPSPETIATLGGGWVAEEALAISVYCALVAPDFEQGVLLAVNHSATATAPARSQETSSERCTATMRSRGTGSTGSKFTRRSTSSPATGMRCARPRARSNGKTIVPRAAGGTATQVGRRRWQANADSTTFSSTTAGRHRNSIVSSTPTPSLKTTRPSR